MKKLALTLLGASLLAGALYAGSTNMHGNCVSNTKVQQNISTVQQEHIKFFSQDVDYGG